MASSPTPAPTPRSPVVDDPPGKDGYQGVRADAEFPPVPDYAAGTNPPGTNPPFPPAQDPALAPIPGMLPGVPLEDYPKAGKPPVNQHEQERQKERQQAQQATQAANAPPATPPPHK